ncbi:MAG: HAMP domain-containing protein [Dehalococcoidia bacterium]|nr:HAMP domain-containing protein [Dehalococcoidia bacterium]
MLDRLGLQKRITVYVTTGMVVLFGAFAYLGIQAVDRSTEMVFQDRLAIAQGAAASVSRDIIHVIENVQEQTSGLTTSNDRAALETAAFETFAHLTATGHFSFFTVTSVWLLDISGQFLAAAPAESAGADQQMLAANLAQALAAHPGAWALSVDGGRPGQFASIGAPLLDAQGNTWGWVVANTEPVSSSEPYVPYGPLGLVSAEWPLQTEQSPQYAQYHLEVLGSSGIAILGIGPDELVGFRSLHHSLVKSAMDARGNVILLHEPAADLGIAPHVIAGVPVPMSDMYLILEQDKDVALALPDQLRRNLIVVGSLGFVLTLLMAWVITRSIVKPTEELTAAAVQMASGELSVPIQVHARDEIGVLAENLETMRQQLKDALDRVEGVNRDLELRVKERTRQLQELVGRVLTAQEEERRRVARELHDETAQALTALTLTLDSVVRRPDRVAPETAARLQEARQMAANMLEGIRRLIYALRPAALDDVGLAAALRGYTVDSLERSGVTIHVAEQGPAKKMPEHVELTLYRIGQEALNNVARHARANNVWITITHYDTITHQGTVVRLIIRDDGIGFDPATIAGAVPRARGIGLAGMRERANLIGGQVIIQSAPGNGTTVEVEVPI